MTQTKNIFYISAKEDNVSRKISYALSSFINNKFSGYEEIVILCIGSDRVTGDSLGPLVGYKLTRFTNRAFASLSGDHRRRFHLYGTLEAPVHAMNLEETIEIIKKKHPFAPVIAIDASLGTRKYLGFITIGTGPLHPGTGVHKALPAVGDLYITGIVNTAGMLEQMVLQTTRLSTVMSLADCISQGIAGFLLHFI